MSDSGDQREEIVSIIALLREVDKRLNRLGGKQAMSIGPVLSETQAVEEKVHEHARGYGVIGSDETLASLKHDAATGRDVSVREQPEWAVDGAVITAGDTKIVVMEEGGEPATLDHVSERDGYAAYRINGGDATLRFMEASE